LITYHLIGSGAKAKSTSSPDMYALLFFDFASVPESIERLRFDFKQSIVAVWALLQGSTFFFLGLLCVLENVAASRKAVALRDQLRTLLLLTGLFFVAWMIAGNVWCFPNINFLSFNLMRN
jgi:hypothetical protein